jgi:hypothetical protein
MISKITGLMGGLCLLAGPVFSGINVIENQSVTDPYFVQNFNAGMVN